VFADPGASLSLPRQRERLVMTEVALCPGSPPVGFAAGRDAGRGARDSRDSGRKFRGQREHGLDGWSVSGNHDGDRWLAGALFDLKGGSAQPVPAEAAFIWEARRRM